MPGERCHGVALEVRASVDDDTKPEASSADRLLRVLPDSRAVLWIETRSIFGQQITDQGESVEWHSMVVLFGLFDRRSPGSSPLFDSQAVAEHSESNDTD